MRLAMSYGKCGMKPRLTPPIIPGTHTPEPAHGEVRREGGNTYVWDGKLKCWIQTRHAEDH